MSSMLTTRIGFSYDRAIYVNLYGVTYFRVILLILDLCGLESASFGEMVFPSVVLYGLASEWRRD